MKIGLRILQILIGLLLLSTSIGKLLDIRGFAAVLLTYEFFPEGAVLTLAPIMSLFELILALWIFSGVWMKLSASIAVLLHVQFTVIAVVSNLRGLDIPNCGCFGVFWARPMTWGTVLEDLVLTLVCVMFFLLARGVSGSVDHHKIQKKSMTKA